jgi:hypothetical protein
MMYVAKYNGSSSVAQYAVAIRGTNGKVLLDWFVDDMDVYQMMPWPFGSSFSSAVALISESTNIGLTVLLSMQNSTGQTLFEFLTAEMSSSAVTQAGICFTGHSLGGTLASALACYARDTQTSWDPQSKATVTTITFAAPTAGDDNFANYFNKAFSYTTTALPYWTPPAGFSSYADCIRNSFDLAPKVWNSTTLKAAPSTYDWHLLVPPVGTSEIVNDIAKALESQTYTQIQATQAVWEGTFESESGASHKWLDEVDYQHVDAYPILLGVPQLLKIFSSGVILKAMADALDRRSGVRHRRAATA